MKCVYLWKTVRHINAQSDQQRKSNVYKECTKLGCLPFAKLGKPTRMTMNRVWILDAVEKGIDERQRTWVTLDHRMPFIHQRPGKKQIEDDPSLDNQSRSLCLRIDGLHQFNCDSGEQQSIRRRFYLCGRHEDWLRMNYASIAIDTLAEKGIDS